MTIQSGTNKLLVDLAGICGAFVTIPVSLTFTVSKDCKDPVSFAATVESQCEGLVCFSVEISALGKGWYSYDLLNGESSLQTGNLYSE